MYVTRRQLKLVSRDKVVTMGRLMQVWRAHVANGGRCGWIHLEQERHKTAVNIVSNATLACERVTKHVLHFISFPCRC